VRVDSLGVTVVCVFFNRKIVKLQVWDPESLLSTIVPLVFFLICVSHHISFLMIPVLCHATRYSWSYSRLRIFDQKIVRLKVCMPNHYCRHCSSCIFLLIHLSDHIISITIPLLCCASRYSLFYGRLRFLSRKTVKRKVYDAESLQSLLFLPYFFLIRFLDHIRFLMIHYCAVRVDTLEITAV
jgi:hypothetical protein